MRCPIYRRAIGENTVYDYTPICQCSQPLEALPAKHKMLDEAKHLYFSPSSISCLTTLVLRTANMHYLQLKGQASHHISHLYNVATTIGIIDSEFYTYDKTHKERKNEYLCIKIKFWRCLIYEQKNFTTNY